MVALLIAVAITIPIYIFIIEPRIFGVSEVKIWVNSKHSWYGVVRDGDQMFDWEGEGNDYWRARGVSEEDLTNYNLITLRRYGRKPWFVAVILVNTVDLMICYRVLYILEIGEKKKF